MRSTPEQAASGDSDGTSIPVLTGPIPSHPRTAEERAEKERLEQERSHRLQEARDKGWVPLSTSTTEHHQSGTYSILDVLTRASREHIGVTSTSQAHL